MYNFITYNEILNKRKVQRACPIVNTGEILTFQKPKIVYGYCIEPLDINIKLINSIFEEMKIDTTSHVKVIKMAMNSYIGTATFPKNIPIGDEGVGLESGKKVVTDNVPTNSIMTVINSFRGIKPGTEETSKKYDDEDFVPMSNLDTFVTENKIAGIIDFVSIDTEGYDAEVILGFVKTLSAKYVRLLEFEYHNVRRWATADLQMLITLLDLLNYDCFWQGNQGQLWRLTSCWHRDYSKKRFWSNIVCINRKEASHELFANLSKKYM